MVCVTTQSTDKDKVERCFREVTKLLGDTTPKELGETGLAKLVLKVERMGRHEEEEDERFSSLERDIDELRGLVQENVQSLFKRGEHVTSLLQKADTFELTVE